MTQNIVVVLTREQEDFSERLSLLNLPDLEIIIPTDVDNASLEVAKANILLGYPTLTSKYINEAKNVTWVQSVFAGVDSLCTSNFREDYLLTNVRNVYGEVMAEYTFAYLLMFEREILENIALQKEHTWLEREAKTLKNKTLAILGAGSIGKDIAKIAKAFGMRTLGCKTTSQPVESFDEIFVANELEAMLPQADYIVNVLPKTKDTDNLINKHILSCMKKTAIFINIGRGNAVNEQDLIQAVNEKRIAKAVLDVFNEEPLPKENPLWSTENVYITPHFAGYFSSDKILEIFAENYDRFIKNKDLLYKVNIKKGY